MCFVVTITTFEYCLWLNKVFRRISQSFKQKLIFLVNFKFEKFTKFGKIFKGMETVQMKNFFVFILTFQRTRITFLHGRARDVHLAKNSSAIKNARIFMTAIKDMFGEQLYISVLNIEN